MVKMIIGLGLFAILVIAFASCSRLLRPSKTTRKQTVANNNEIATIKNSSYDTSDVFTGTIVKNIAYKTDALNYKGDKPELTLDVYKPAKAEGKKFPVVFLIHGGSFTGGDKNGLASTCSKLANNGYVAISINYRLGWGFISRSSTTCNDTDHLKQAIYRAVQDTHAAMHYVAKHADEYNVDKNWFFLGGQSAGAITALMTAYLKDKDIAAFFSDNYVQKFGPADITENDSDAAFTLKGVISMWGAFANPELITTETALPTIFFQGELDKAVPFYSRTFAPCNSATLVYGTYPLYNRLKALNETAIAHVDPKGGHGVFEENFRVENILCFLNDVRQGIKKQVYLTGIQYSCDK